MSRVTVELASRTAPAEIRDDRLRFVANASSGSSVELRPGRYFATAILPGGEEDTRAFEVTGGANITVRLGHASSRPDGSRLRQVPRMAFRPRPRGQPSGARAREPREPGVVIANREQASIKEDRSARWHLRFLDDNGRLQREPPEILVADSEAPAVARTSRPAALDEIVVPLVIRSRGIGATRFAQYARVGGVPLNVALPLGPSTTECDFEVRLRPRRLSAIARPAGESPAVRNVADYVAAGQFAQAAELASDAEAMLFQKLANPIGATVGGYALLRLGGSEQLRDWPRNLQEWFPWLPDGAIIAGELALRRGDSPRSPTPLRDRASAQHTDLYGWSVVAFQASSRLRTRRATRHENRRDRAILGRQSPDGDPA